MPFLAGQTLTADALNAIQPMLIRKTSDETISNSAALQADDHLTANLLPNSSYTVDLHVAYTSNTTPGLKTDFSLPSGATITQITFVAGGTNAAVQHGVSTSAVGAINAIAGTGTQTGLQAHFVITTAGTPGALTLRWAQNTANASDTTVHAGSWMRVTRIT